MDMVESVLHLNIEHFRKKLADEEPDEAKCRTIRRLLAREEAKLAALDDPPQLKKQG